MYSKTNICLVIQTQSKMQISKELFFTYTLWYFQCLIVVKWYMWNTTFIIHSECSIENLRIDSTTDSALFPQTFILHNISCSYVVYYYTVHNSVVFCHSVFLTRHAFVKHRCPWRQQSQNMAKVPFPPLGACDVSEVWATFRWIYNPSLVTVWPSKL